jgi:hypothetical protein
MLPGSVRALGAVTSFPSMKLYQPVKDMPRRFCPTGWGLPRLADRDRSKSEATRMTAADERGRRERLESSSGGTGEKPFSTEKPRGKA